MDATNHLEDTTMARDEIDDIMETPVSQLAKDMNTQDVLVREIEDRVELLTRRIKPLLLDKSSNSEGSADCGPTAVPLRSALGQDVAEQNNRLRAISQRLARLENEVDL